MTSKQDWLLHASTKKHTQMLAKHKQMVAKSTERDPMDQVLEEHDAYRRDFPREYYGLDRYPREY